MGSYLGDICCEWYFQDIYTTSMKIYTQALIDTRTSDKRFKNVNNNYEIIGENTANYVETFIPVADLLQRVKRIYDEPLKCWTTLRQCWSRQKTKNYKAGCGSYSCCKRT